MCTCVFVNKDYAYPGIILYYIILVYYTASSCRWTFFSTFHLLRLYASLMTCCWFAARFIFYLEGSLPVSEHTVFTKFEKNKQNLVSNAVSVSVVSEVSLAKPIFPRLSSEPVLPGSK